MNKKTPLVYLRSIWVYFNAAFFLLILRPYLWHVEKYKHNDYALFETKIYPIVHFVAARIFKLTGSTYWIKGVEHIPRKGPVLFVGNHQSFFDIVLLLATIPRVAGFLAKAELQKVPLLNRWITGIGSTYLDRGGGRKSLETIIQSARHLKDTSSAIVVFPEGTRSEDGQLRHFKPGVLKIAERSGATIVPFAIHKTHTLMTKGSIWMFPHKVGIEYLEPIVLANNEKFDTVSISKHVEDCIRERIKTGEKNET